MLQSDTTFDGQYKLLKLLGRGGFSEVWLAEDEYIHLQVVLKVYAPGNGMDDDGIQTIGNEFKLMFNLSHPNLLDPRGFSVYNKMPYLVLPYCTKGSVLNLISRMNEEQVWQFIAQVASGLAYLHERDIIHQDIKPDNILIDDNGAYQITDFGISTKARSTLRKSVLLGNNSGGTTAYMGPERFSREPDPVKASDIWSLGATVFELMTGNLPFGELGGGMQKNGAEIPLIKGDYSDKLKNIVEQMLALETWNRPTAEKLVEWCADQSKITINQTEIPREAEPQDPPHTGHATRVIKGPINEETSSNNYNNTTHEPKVEVEKPDPQENKQPKCLKKFNWGAFLLLGLWGLFNKHAWLFFVNWGLNIIDRLAGNDGLTVTIIVFVLKLSLGIIYGFIGNREAWDKVDGMTAERFDQKQHRWNVAGIVVLVILVLCFVLGFIGALL